jgi:hypothetical protein
MKKIFFLCFIAALTLTLATACGSKKQPETKTTPKIGPVAFNVHPDSLEGKTVVLRWNGKYNGDILLTKVGDLLSRKVKDLKVVKMWETDKTTAVISDGLDNSLVITKKIVDLKPAIVIASQAD